VRDKPRRHLPGVVAGQILTGAFLAGEHARHRSGNPAPAIVKVQWAARRCSSPTAFASSSSATPAANRGL
jgi:hypothetical protein